MTYIVPTKVPLNRIADLLCSALEGGSNYWYRIEKFGKPPALLFRTDESKVFRHIDYPMNEGGWLVISSLEEPEREHVTLTLDKLKEGLRLMAEKYPHHWANFIKEDEDGETGDVMLQLALFGDVIYG